MKMKHLLCASALALATLTTGCKQITGDGSESSSAADTSEWGRFVGGFVGGYFPLNPDFAVRQGNHEFDGQLPNWSEAGLKAQSTYLEKAVADAKAFDTKKLSDKQKFQRDYLVHVAEGQLFFLKDADFPHKNPDFYTDALDPNVYISRPYADAKKRMKAFIAYAKNVPTAAAQIKANLKLPLPASFVKYGQAGFGGFAEYYAGDAKKAFASVKDADLQKQFDEAVGAAAAAMKDLSNYVASKPATTGGFEMGAANFSKMILTNEGVDTPLAELEAIGRADLKRNQDALKVACATFAPGATMIACMTKMGANKAADGPVAEARRQLPGLKQFLITKDLVSIPGTEEALVEESPPYNRQNAAYIDIPGPYENGLPSVYYISPPDPAWDKATQDSCVPGRKDLVGTSVH